MDITEEVGQILLKNKLKKEMNTIKKMWYWLVKSSANANNWSLTVKGALVSIIPIIIMVTNLANIHLQTADLTATTDAIVSIVAGFATLVSAVITTVGLVRKLYKTIVGTNAVLNQ